MLSFVIPASVVANAILTVRQSLNNIRERGMQHHKAVLEFVCSRIRSIYMSATIFIFDMLLLAISLGSGSEFHRGLEFVILGRLSSSTFFTIFVIPSLLMFLIDMGKPGRQAG